MKRLILFVALAFAVLTQRGSAQTTAAPGFSVASMTVDETVGNAIITITKTGATCCYSQVKFATVPGSALPYVRYQPISFTVTFFGSDTTKSIAVPIIFNAAAQPTQSFTISLTPIHNATIVGSPATITIVDNDAPPPPPQWISAPLQDGNFARVKANDSLWDMTGQGSGRQLVPGEIVAIYFNGWGYDGPGAGGASFAIYTLSDGVNGRALAADLEGVAPVGAAPGLPANWWVPGLVKATKTCPNARNATQPGVTQGSVYRAAMLAGSHTKLATGQTSVSSIWWIVYATGDLAHTAASELVTGDCLIGA